jgi:hypothetical protein
VLALASAAGGPADEAHAAGAVALLRRSVAAGFRDTPLLLTDNDLAALRGRADYAELLWDLAEAPAKP